VKKLYATENSVQKPHPAAVSRHLHMLNVVINRCYFKTWYHILQI